jgi:hypothetical protein
MLAMMAPDHPAQIAVIKVAITLQHTARVSVRLCVSIFSLSLKSPFRGLLLTSFSFLLSLPDQ